MKKHYLLTNLFIFCFLVINAQNSPSVKFKSIIKPTFRQTSTLAAQIDSIELYNDKTAFFMTVLFLMKMEVGLRLIRQVACMLLF